MTQVNTIKIGSYIYSEADLIGKGSFGKVFKGKSLANGNAVAIKVVNMGAETSKQNLLVRMIKNEVDALKRVNNENIVQFMDCIIANNIVYIVTEYCNQKDLRHYLTKHKYLDEKKAVEFLRQIVNAFKEMCKQQVMHRDLKPANVLLHNGICKIADFGFAKTLDFSVTDYNTHMVSIVGTPLYMSPQLLEKQKYSTKSDIWSLGIIFFEMLYGRVPWPGKDPATYVKNIKSQPLVIDRDFNNISPEAEDFLIKCLKVKEEERMGWNELFEHPLITGMPLASLMRTDSGIDYWADFAPEKQMQEYQTRAVNPSNLMKLYQDKILQASRDILHSQSTLDLPKTTIDQKLKHINQIAMNNSALLRGNLYAPQSRTFMMSFNAALSVGEKDINKSQNENMLHTNRFKSGMQGVSRDNSPSIDASASPLNRKSTMKKLPEEVEKELQRIDAALNIYKNKITLFDDLQTAVNNSEVLKDYPLLKFNLLLVAAKICGMIFKKLSGQILPKRIKTKSPHLEEYYQSDNYKKLVVFCETQKKYFEDGVKRISRRMFDLDFKNDKDKDEALDYYQEILEDTDEQSLLVRVVDLSNQVLFSLNHSGNPNSPKDREYLESLLNVFGDESIVSLIKNNKFDSILAKVAKIKEENKQKK